MAYTTYDTPGEFFNISPTTGAYAISAATITLGCDDHATSANQFLTNLTAAQAHLTTGSTSQVVFGIVDALYNRFNSIATVDKPSKLNIVRSSYEDTLNGTLVRTYSFTVHLTPGSFVAVNS